MMKTSDMDMIRGMPDRALLALLNQYYDTPDDVLTNLDSAVAFVETEFGDWMITPNNSAHGRYGCTIWPKKDFETLRMTDFHNQPARAMIQAFIFVRIVVDEEWRADVREKIGYD